MEKWEQGGQEATRVAPGVRSSPSREYVCWLQGRREVSLLPLPSPQPAGLVTTLAHTEAREEMGWPQGSPAPRRGTTVRFRQLRDRYRGVNGHVNGEDRMQVPSLRQIRWRGAGWEKGGRAERWAAGAGEVSIGV